MLMTSERWPAIRTLRGWAFDVLQEVGAIRECEEHGWMQDRADPHARERASPDLKDALRAVGEPRRHKAMPLQELPMFLKKLDTAVSNRPNLH
jgi:hypothetical protein